MPRAVRSQRQINRFLDLTRASASYRSERRAQAIEEAMPPDLSDEYASLDLRVTNLEAP